MADMKNISKLLVLSVTLAGLTLGLAQVPALADTTVVDGPGFKVEKKNGWFGTSKTTYYDALGNRYEKKKGPFGRATTKSKMFGSETEKKGDNVVIKGPDGTPLVSKKKSLLGGEKTYVDGNGIFKSFKNLFKSP